MIRETEHWLLKLGDHQKQLETWLAPKEGHWRPNVLGATKEWYVNELMWAVLGAWYLEKKNHTWFDENDNLAPFKFQELDKVATLILRAIQDGEIIVSLATPELTWSLDSILFSTESFSQLTAGDYIIYFTNGHCVQSEIVRLEEKLINPFHIASVIDVPVNSTIQITHSYMDSVSYDFSWSPSDYLDCFNCPSPLFSGSLQDVLLTVLVTV